MPGRKATNDIIIWKEKIIVIIIIILKYDEQREKDKEARSRIKQLPTIDNQDYEHYVVLGVVDGLEAALGVGITGKLKMLTRKC